MKLLINHNSTDAIVLIFEKKDVKGFFGDTMRAKMLILMNELNCMASSYVNDKRRTDSVGHTTMAVSKMVEQLRTRAKELLGSEHASNHARDNV